MILIYHHNDLDGCASAAVVALYEKKKVYNRVCDYNKNIPCLETYHKIVKQVNQTQPTFIEKIYIVDYSFTKTTQWQLEELLSLNIPIIWIDHHISSLDVDIQNNNLTSYINIDYCGAYNAYVYLMQNTPPEVIKLVDSWDTFKLNIAHTLEFKYYFDTKSLKEVTYEILDLLKQSNTDLSHIFEVGSYLKMLMDKQYEVCRNKTYEMNIQGYKCIVCNTFLKSSNVFGDLLKQYDFGVVWQFDGDCYSYSIYSDVNKEYCQCNAMAEHFGGGGHPHAAGFKLNYLLK